MTADSAYPSILSPLTKGRLRLKNRIVFPAHQTLLSEGGAVGQRMRAYYGARARGGVGGVIVEGAAVHPTTIKFPEYLVAYDPAIVPSLDTLATELHASDCRAILQLAHSGSRMSTHDSRRPLWAPSDVRSAISREIPHAMTGEDIRELIDGYSAAVANVAASEMDGVEIHSAHEYLLGAFLSPLNNRREDEYGGSLDNRMRLLFEVLGVTRREIGPNRVVGVRLNGDDLVEGGLTSQDYLEIARRVTATGLVDYLSISAGTSADNHMIVPPMDVPEGVYVPFAAAIRDVVDVPVFAVGRLKRPAHVESVIASGQADVVAMARALIADPDWVNKLARTPARIRMCIGCNQGCFGNLYSFRAITCTVNPDVGREGDRRLSAAVAADEKKVVVVGGGPAGLEAAITAAEAGYGVVLFESTDELGGQVPFAASVRARAELREAIDYQVAEVRRLSIDVRSGRAADVVALEAEAADLIVVATGSKPRPSPFPFGDGIPVMAPVHLLRSTVDWADTHVVVVDEVGHFQAYVPAEVLADAGAHVTVVTDSLAAGNALDQATAVTMLRRLTGKGVEFVLNTRVIEATDEGAVLVDVLRDRRRTVAADALVIANGGVANDDLLHVLRAAGRKVIAIGDCVAPRTILEAVREGRNVVRALNCA